MLVKGVDKALIIRDVPSAVSERDVVKPLIFRGLPSAVSERGVVKALIIRGLPSAVLVIFVHIVKHFSSRLYSVKGCIGVNAYF